MAFSMIPCLPPSRSSGADGLQPPSYPPQGSLQGAGWRRYLRLLISQQACDLLQQHKREVNVDVSSVQLWTKCSCFKRANCLQNLAANRRCSCFVPESHGEGQENDLVIRSVSSPLQEFMSLHITDVGLVTFFFWSLHVHCQKQPYIYAIRA